jgi:calcineurin-like phosphoesterase family protein
MADKFTSDLHIGHERCAIAFRPHTSLDDMHDFIITHWNLNVYEEDDVFVLGDIFMGQWKTLELANDFLNKLNFKSFNIVPGNHDNVNFLKSLSANRKNKGLTNVNVLDYLLERRFDTGVKNVKKYPLVCSHYPLASWSTVSKGIGHIHGHCHMAYRGQGRILDVGWDSIYYGGPGIWTIDMIKEYMSKREIYSVDYH